MRWQQVCILTISVGFVTQPSSASAQGYWGGGSSIFPLPRADRQQGFEAEVAYISQGQQTEISRMTFLGGKGKVTSWMVNRASKPNRTREPASYIFYYHPRWSIVFKGSPEILGNRVQPTLASCLLRLKRSIERDGEASVRTRYRVPAEFPITDYTAILKEERVGANSGRSAGNYPGSNFLVNEMPSEFGYPPLMYRLLVGTPEAFRLAHFTDLQAARQEVVAGHRWITSVKLWVSLPCIGKANRDDERRHKRSDAGGAWGSGTGCGQGSFGAGH